MKNFFSNNKSLLNSLNFSIICILIFKDWGLSKLSISTRSEIVLDVYYSFTKIAVSIVKLFSLLGFSRLSDIVVYDRPGYKVRYILSYILTNIKKDSKLRIRTSASAEYTVLPSVEKLVFSSSWAEREVLDMFGIKFIGHSDLRRIIGDYGFWGYPGRKDFPVSGSYSYLYTINFLRVFKVRGTLKNVWHLMFQKNIYK